MTEELSSEEYKNMVCDKRAEEAHQEYIIDKLSAELEQANNIIAELSRYFTSGNSVPVDRATISAKVFWKLLGQEPKVNAK